MKRTLLIIVSLMFFVLAKAQTKAIELTPYVDEARKNQIVDSLKKKGVNINYAVEQEPKFPGGQQALFAFLSANTRYPSSAVRAKRQGKVFITFIVQKDGYLTDIKVLKGISPDLDAEAVRVMEGSPRWTPGIQNGIPVNVTYTVAVTFKLSPKELSENSPPEDTLLGRKIDSLNNIRIFAAVEYEPTFPGGDRALNNYLNSNIKNPENINASVYLQFVVEKDGSLSQISVIRGASDSANTEAIRLLKECPNWNPGVQNNRLVRVAYTLRIFFKPDH